MEITIRRAKASDAPALHSLYLELVGNDPNINVTENAIASIENDASNFLLVAETANQIVGTAFISICRDVMYGNQPFAVLENIVVTTAARGQGIGNNLISQAKSICKEQRCTKIMLLSSTARPEAHRFFEKNGYRGELKRGFVNYINR